MSNYTDLIKAIKKASVDAIESNKPVNVAFGKVTSESPLKIQVDQKIILTAAQLILTRNVTDFETKITVDNIDVYHTTKTPPPTKTWMDAQKVTVHNTLKVGEEVVLIRQQGGQKYIVIDRLG